MKKYHIATYGCQMNEYDSGVLSTMMESFGVESTENPAEASYILVNTCSVRAKAEEVAIARMGHFKPLKERNPDLRVAVLGCMAKNRGEALRSQLPFVDFVVGPEGYGSLPGLLGLASEASKAPETPDPELGFFAKPSSAAQAFVGIQRGCNKRCSYCIVPFVRGAETYRDPQAVLAEARALAGRGVKELTLLGQTVNAYRAPGMDFAGLLRAVARVDGIERVRFTSPHPRHYTPELIETLLSEPKLCPHAHIPLQSGSDSMLKKMRRQYTRDEYLRIVEKLRGAAPFYGISTDIIVGFVGETEADFEDTLSLVEECQFDSAFMFAYSPREGTESARETETLSEGEKQARLARLIETQNAITKKRNLRMVGRAETILLEGPSSRSPEEWVGKTGSFKKVVVPRREGMQAGDLVRVQITDMQGWTLRGNLC